MKDIVNKDQEFVRIFATQYMNYLSAKKIREDFVKDLHPILKQMMGATYITDFSVRCKIYDNIEEDDIISINIICGHPTSKHINFTVGRIKEILDQYE